MPVAVKALCTFGQKYIVKSSSTTLCKIFDFICCKLRFELFWAQIGKYQANLASQIFAQLGRVIFDFILRTSAQCLDHNLIFTQEKLGSIGHFVLHGLEWRTTKIFKTQDIRVVIFTDTVLNFVNQGFFAFSALFLDFCEVYLFISLRFWHVFSLLILFDI